MPARYRNNSRQEYGPPGKRPDLGTDVGFKPEIQLEPVVPVVKACAVVEEPWSAHPEAMYGHYDNDLAFRIFYEHSTYDDHKAKEWMDEWVYAIRDRKEYIEHYVERFGFDKLMRLKLKPFYSGSVNYGRPLPEVF